MNTPTMLRTGKRVLDITNGLIFELIYGGNVNTIVHVSRIEDGPDPNQRKGYAKYRGAAARALWTHVCQQATDLVDQS